MDLVMLITLLGVVVTVAILGYLYTASTTSKMARGFELIMSEIKATALLHAEERHENTAFHDFIKAQSTDLINEIRAMREAVRSVQTDEPAHSGPGL